ncbi:hypothetical protein CHS0354_033504 [Potamilus streckersoni]|uniref:RGS domain-containing protein n=1 Tax=Potamilus streckersoni TaxID=2493646 RepID=A0AAE0VSM8_9BIVA|nr:hypothetical protein CHS0354_033504 [Potamilus streckersoni]
MKEMARYRRAKAQITQVDIDLAEREDSGVQLDEPPSPHSKQHEEYFDYYVHQPAGLKSKLTSVARPGSVEGQRSRQGYSLWETTKDTCGTNSRNLGLFGQNKSDTARSVHGDDLVAQHTVDHGSTNRLGYHNVVKSSEQSKESRSGRLLESKKLPSKRESIEEDEGVGIKESISEADDVCSRLQDFHVHFHCEYHHEDSEEESKFERNRDKICSITEDNEEDDKVICPKERDTRKRRFRNLISHPLRRSRSAGSESDLQVPHYALFLQYNMGSKDGNRKHSSETSGTGSKKHPETRTLIDTTSHEDSLQPPRSVHKTSSADAAMMGRLDIPDSHHEDVPVKTKHKSSIASCVKRKLKALRRRNTDSCLEESTLKMQTRKISRTEALEWSKSFESLLFDKVGLKLFREFLKSEYSEDNLDFWTACEEFKSTKPSQYVERAQRIFSEYIAIKAPKEINLDSKTRLLTEGDLAHPTADTFSTAQKRIQLLMEKDSYPRFLESDVYTQLVGAAISRNKQE